MIGEVIVQEPADYEAWLATGRAEGSLASAGGKLYQDLACNTCHRPDAQGRGPILQGLFGKTVTFENGSRQIVDEAYLRESILTPNEKLTQGFQPVMPAYQGLVSEEGVLQLIEYIKAIGTQPQTEPVRPASGGPAPGEPTPSRGNEVNR
jgi:cytochrome c oxidase subunit 2